jgi:hypothetical protein
MDLFRYIVRFLYKIRWYLIILPMIALIVSWFSTRNMERIYDTNTTIYTGMITGYNIEGGIGTAGGMSQTNMTKTRSRHTRITLCLRWMRKIRQIRSLKTIRF